MLYFLWLFIQKRFNKNAETEGKATPWTWLALFGLAFVVVSLFVTGLLSGSKLGGTYIPPHIMGDEIIPGRVK